MKRIVVILLAFIFGLQTVVGQRKKKKKDQKKDTIRTEVINVVTSYTPTIADAFKIKRNPLIKLSDKSKKKKLTYQIFSAPVASTFVPKSGAVKGIDVGKKERLFDNYAAVGFGNYTTPFAEVFVHRNTRFNNEYGFYAKYISSENGVDGTLLESGYRNINAGAYYTQEERYFTWKLGGDLALNQYNWYGLPNITFDTASIAAINEQQSYNFLEVDGQLIFEDSYIDDVKASLSFFSDDYKSSEILFSVQPKFILPLDLISRRAKDLELNTSIEYLTGSFNQSYANNTKLSHQFFNLGVNPVYRFDYKKFNIKVGTKLYLMADLEHKLTDFFIYPDIQITYPLARNLANIYVGAGGDLHMNTYRSLSEENPFVSPTLFVTQTNEQYSFFGGINGKFASNVSYDFRANYKNIEDQAMFVRNNSKSNGVHNAALNLKGYEYGNSFGVLYDDVTVFSLFGEVEFDLTKQFVMGINGQLNSYSTTFQQEAWNLPELKSTIFGKYKAHKWYASANVFMIGERNDVFYSGAFPSTVAGKHILAAYVDANLDGGYHFSDFFSVFVKVNNVLNNNYQRFSNFNVQGLQVLGGITYKFDF